MKITVDYKNGSVVPDFHVVKFIQDALANGEDFSIGSELLLMALKVEIQEGRFKGKYIKEGSIENVVIIHYNGDPYYIKENGRMNKGIPDNVVDDLLDILIGI